MTRTRRPVFDPKAIDDDIEDFFSAPPTTPTSVAESTSTPASAQQPPSAPSRAPKEAAAGETGELEPVTRQTASPKRKPKANGDVVATPVDSRPRLPAPSSPPEVSIDPDVYPALRRLTLNERRTDPTTARSYGMVVLDAIDQTADRLSEYWRSAPRVARTNSLFSRSEPPRRRRRHATPPARVPLAGVSTENAERLDDLAAEWHAGNRSILVEQALRLYLQVHPASIGAVDLPR